MRKSQAGFDPPPVDAYEADALPTKPPRLNKFNFVRIHSKIALDFLCKIPLEWVGNFGTELNSLPNQVSNP